MYEANSVIDSNIYVVKHNTTGGSNITFDSPLATFHIKSAQPQKPGSLPAYKAPLPHYMRGGVEFQQGVKFWHNSIFHQVSVVSVINLYFSNSVCFFYLSKIGQ